MDEMTLNTEIEEEFRAVNARLIEAAEDLLARKLISPWSGQVSAKLTQRLTVPGSDREEDLIAISRSGYSMTFGLITEGGTVVRMGGNYPSWGHPIHLGLYKARPDARAVVRFRGLYADAASTILGRIPLAIETFWCLGDEPVVVPLDTLQSDTLEGFISCMGAAVAEAAKTHPQATVMSVAHYGAWSLGANLEQACMRAYAAEEFSERAFARQCLARAAGSDAPAMPDWLVKVLTPYSRPSH